MKVLFLDVDGVINPISFHHGSGFSGAACANIQSVLDKDPEVRIVVSSAWRRWGIEKLKEILKDNNIDSSKLEDITDTEGGLDPENRAEQIQRWLDKHKQVKQFVVIDDYPMPALDANAVKTNGYVGFTQKDADIALGILNK